MRHRLHFIVAVATIAVVMRSVAVATPDEELQRYFKQYLEERFALHPMMATELGDHRFDSRLDDLSPKAIERSQEHLKKSRGVLKKAVDRSKLSRDGQISWGGDTAAGGMEQR